MNRSRCGQEGFAFLLATGVMVAVGAAAIVGTQVYKDVSAERQQRERSINQLTVVQDALIDYVARNKRLPCPANGTLAANHQNAGAEVAAASGKCTLPNDNRANGVVPWKTLGLAPDLAIDRWGRKISYRVFDRDSAGNTVPAVSAVDGANLNLQECVGRSFDKKDALKPKRPVTEPMATAAKDTPAGYIHGKLKSTKSAGDGLTEVPALNKLGASDVCRRFERQLSRVLADTGLALNSVESGTSNEVPLYDPSVGTGAAFVLISHGENGRGGLLPSGLRSAAAVSNSELVNTQNLDRVISRPFAGSNGNIAYDDIVLAMTTLDLAVAAGLGPKAGNACTDGFVDLNDCADQVFGAVNADGTLQFAGGSGASEMKILTADGQSIRSGSKLKTGTTERPIVLNIGKLDVDQNGVGEPGDPQLGDGVTVSLGKNACIWDTTVRDFDNIDDEEPINPLTGKRPARNPIFRAYWEFRSYGINAQQSADGFVFGLVPNATFSRHAVPCGNTQTFTGFDAHGELKPGNNDGTDLAWVGSTQLDPKTLTIKPANASTFLGPKMGLEFDLWFSDFNYRNDAITVPADSASLATQRNHVAVLRENSTVHGVRPPCKNGTYNSIIGLGSTSNLQLLFGALYGCSNDYSIISANWTAAGLLADMSNWNTVMRWVNPTSAEYNAAKAKLFRTNPPCDAVSAIPGQIGCTYNAAANWMEDRVYTSADPGTPYRVRLEVARKCNASCAQCGLDAGTNVLFKAWVDCKSNRCGDVSRPLPVEFNNLARTDLAGNRINYCMKDPGLDVPAIADQMAGATGLFGAAAYNRFRTGYTFGTGGANSGLQITNYRAGVFTGPLPPAVMN